MRILPARLVLRTLTWVKISSGSCTTKKKEYISAWIRVAIYRHGGLSDERAEADIRIRNAEARRVYPPTHDSIVVIRLSGSYPELSRSAGASWILRCMFLRLLRLPSMACCEEIACNKELEWVLPRMTRVPPS